MTKQENTDKDFIISVAVLYELNFNALTQYLNGYQKKKKKNGNSISVICCWKPRVLTK